MHREYLKELENNNHNMFELFTHCGEIQIRSIYIYIFMMDVDLISTLPSKVAAIYAAHVQRKPACCETWVGCTRFEIEHIHCSNPHTVVQHHCCVLKKGGILAFSR